MTKPHPTDLAAAVAETRSARIMAMLMALAAIGPGLSDRSICKETK